MISEVSKRGVSVDTYARSYAHTYNTRHGLERAITPEEATSLRAAIRSYPKLGGFAPADMIAAVVAQPHGPRRTLVMDIIRRGVLDPGAIRTFSENELPHLKSVPESLVLPPSTLSEIVTAPHNEAQVDGILKALGDEAAIRATERQRLREARSRARIIQMPKSSQTST